tara:strand:- start:239 stop:985 length:747 start_codon:yes stop_codon:yes gene_type:complete
MAHRPGHNSFDSTTFRRMKDKFNEDQLRSSDGLESELDLPQFSFRGKDAFQKNLRSAETKINNSYFDPRGMEDFNPSRKYPYLSSQHLINPELKDFNDFNDTNGGYEPPSKRTEERVIQQSRNARGISGNPEILKEYEEAAKASSKIGDNLREARYSNPTENEMSDAIFDAIDAIRSGPKTLGTNPNAPGMEKTNHPAYKNAAMITAYNNLRKESGASQDEADYYRDYFGKRARRPLKDNFFDTRGGE